MCCIACIAFLYGGSCSVAELRLADYSRHTTLYLCSSWYLVLFSVSCAATVRLKAVLLALVMWDLEKTSPDLILLLSSW